MDWLFLSRRAATGPEESDLVVGGGGIVGSIQPATVPGGKGQ